MATKAGSDICETKGKMCQLTIATLIEENISRFDSCPACEWKVGWHENPLIDVQEKKHETCNLAQADLRAEGLHLWNDTCSVCQFTPAFHLRTRSTQSGKASTVDVELSCGVKCVVPVLSVLWLWWAWRCCLSLSRLMEM